MLLSDKFDFKKTYLCVLTTRITLADRFSFIAGIAGVNPFEGTLGSAGLAQFAVQVALA